MNKKHGENHEYIRNSGQFCLTWLNNIKNCEYFFNGRRKSCRKTINWNSYLYKTDMNFTQTHTTPNSLLFTLTQFELWVAQQRTKWVSGTGKVEWVFGLVQKWDIPDRLHAKFIQKVTTNSQVVSKQRDSRKIRNCLLSMPKDGVWLETPNHFVGDANLYTYSL